MDEKGLHSIVLIKQVPDIEKVRFDHEKGRIDRSSAEATTNPFDLNALELAVQVKEKVGGIVTALSMGPPQAESTLRDALARGADRGILLTDQRFAGADTLATSYTLAIAIKKLGHFDLIVCGEKTVDGDTAQVGPEVAEHLGIPHVAYVSEVKNVTREGIIVNSRMGRSYYTFFLRFPGLITVTKDVNVPRLPTLRDMMKARRAQIPVWTSDDLVDIAQKERFGISGSPTQVVRVFTPSTEGRIGKVIQGDAENIAKELFIVLRQLGILG
ncbi:electron transfer flavoprotein subunit beta/FixA family protein [Candidatus Bathyarchaeota archaeon]|nr:electron transfer flavoprotein subunit beta/FixA family protein [Candidatus Bathyarchaeota archaeon]MBS7627386.1 electron transfer flavoprotein subunit beta/FixA family protein [Candidatus Bathyarchaeota archaeon]